MLASLARMPEEGWAERVLLSRRLAAATPSMEAHGLQFCARTTRSVIEVLHRRFGLPDQADLRARLALDLLVAAFHCALEAWLAREESHTRDDLVECVRETFAAIPGAPARLGGLVSGASGEDRTAIHEGQPETARRPPGWRPSRRSSAAAVESSAGR